MSSDILSAVEDELEGDEVERPLLFAFGIVHEVEPRTLAVKAIIPSIDPDRVHDRWIHQAVPWVGTPGNGPAFAPAVGSEVLITGRLGQTYSLLYLSAYNESHPPPNEFADGSRGCKCETVYRLLCDLLIQIKSQTQVQVRGEQRADVESGAVVYNTAPDVYLRSEGGVSVHGQGTKVGFLGAAPTGKKSLPPAATDLASCIALANALRAHEIERGLAQ